MNNKAAILSNVLFSSLGQWDVKQFLLNKIKSIYPVEPLGKHLIHQTEKIQLSDYPDENYTILGVSNKVGMFDAGVKKGKKINQKYHRVENGWIAYNPYRINVGSIGIKTADLKGGYISPAYVVFSCIETLIPQFLWLMMRSEYFNTLIKDSTTGSVRQTLSYEKLATIEAPIPSIPEQEQILKAYHATIAAAEKSMSDGDDFSSGLLFDIQSTVSDLKEQDVSTATTSSILQTVPFSATRRWEVGYIQKEGRIETIYGSFKCKDYSINDLQTESLFGLSVKASETQRAGMIPILRMSNIVDGEIDFRGLKYLPAKCAVTDKEPNKWLLRDGDFLITRTNGSKDLVGKAAVFHGDAIYTYASYLIRYRFNTSVVLPEYVCVLFMMPLVREQIAVMRRQGGGQYNLNSDEIGSIRIPVPSISEQEEIIKKYYSTKDGADKFYTKAEELRKKADTDFEQTLFA